MVAAVDGQANGHTTNGNGTKTNPFTVIVVGAGFAGLTAVIECQRRGMNAILVEKYTKSEQFGDIIDFFNNSGIIVESWDDGKIVDQLLPRCITKVKAGKVMRPDGKHLLDIPWILRGHHKRRQFAGHRGDLWQVFRDYAQEVGVDFRLGYAVTEYLETEDQAGVRLSNGQEIWGDVVIAADGPKSVAREQVLGLKDEPTKSGTAIWRAYLKATDEVKQQSALQDFLRKDEDTFKLWVGGQCIMLAYGWKEGQDLAWVITHPDEHDIGESWSFPADKAEIKEYIKDWHPTAQQIVDVTPPNQIIDYKLVWRPAIKTWRSKGGRTALIGDAAHCHLPDSAQGGSQAMEDAVTVAICLERAAKIGADPKLALKVMERIRFNRAHVIHQAGVGIRDSWNGSATESDDMARKMIGTAKWPEWVVEFNPIETAENNFAQLAQDVIDGKEGAIEDLSLPAGGIYDFEKGF